MKYAIFSIAFLMGTSLPAICLSQSPLSMDARGACRAASQMEHINLPVSDKENQETQITRGTVVSQHGRPLGLMFVLRNGQFWFQDGFIGKASTPQAQHADLLSVLGRAPSAPSRGELFALQSTAVLSLLRSGYGIWSCF